MEKIAEYLGKSIRTIQRWEQESQFPVRRPRNGKGGVLAYTDEIDAWVRGHAAVLAATPADPSEIEQLRNLAAALGEENQQLREKLQAFRIMVPVYKSDDAGRSPRPDIVSLAHSHRLRTAELLRRSAETLDYWRNLRQLLPYKRGGTPILMRMIELIQ